jgi:hypothetical protein
MVSRNQAQKTVPCARVPEFMAMTGMKATPNPANLFPKRQRKKVADRSSFTAERTIPDVPSILRAMAKTGSDFSHEGFLMKLRALREWLRAFQSPWCSQPVNLGAAEPTAIRAVIGKTKDSVRSGDPVAEGCPAREQVRGVIHLKGDVRRRAPAEAEFLLQLHQRRGINNRLDCEGRAHFHDRVGIPGGERVIDE